MNSIFSVDDFSDLLWQAPMTRSASEWELEKFLEEFPASSSICDNNNNDTTTVAVPKSLTSSKRREICEDEVVEIEKVEINSQPLDRAPLPPPEDTDGYHAFLKSQLDLACAAAAAAKSRDSSVKPEGVSSSFAEDQRVINKNCESGSSPVSGNGHGITKGQNEADGGSLRLPALPSMPRKQEVPVRQATSGSSREDSDDDELEGDTETNDNMDPADEKRARRMQSNRESARRSRRRKQAQLNELEAQVGQLRDERTSLLTRLTDINKKCDEASVDNRILNANIETLRTKVKMAEDQVKRVTGLNPMVLARSNMPNMGMQFVAGQTDVSANVAVPMQPNNNHFFHHSVPDLTSGAPHLQRLSNSCPNNSVTPLATPLPVNNGTSNIGGIAPLQQVTGAQNMTDVPPLQHVQKQTGPTVSPPASVLICNKGLSQPVAKDNKKK
ncbi:light-inducible protein CPRF2 [Ricinus communis]|uniref:DNA binding protein, putative n=1 Tax=Ricinus communis TaxID=3988 RepID=B9S4R7_RICCO|nr:light-inducible protein CPRF2 [Ricinus communis]EEF41391.1 DNA binding protein, putative [Ricinus communis]|eukprot:XP_002520974.1 light-inducible protein CPRF2 [Ricinus communis]